MIKDLVVNLSVTRDVAGPYAISLAQAFDAHVSAVAFSYEPVIPPSIIGSIHGGYGHSRLREFILGGATRGILSAMTVPVLMSH